MSHPYARQRGSSQRGAPAYDPYDDRGGPSYDEPTRRSAPPSAYEPVHEVRYEPVRFERGSRAPQRGYDQGGQEERYYDNPRSTPQYEDPPQRSRAPPQSPRNGNGRAGGGRGGRGGGGNGRVAVAQSPRGRGQTPAGAGGLTQCSVCKMLGQSVAFSKNQLSKQLASPDTVKCKSCITLGQTTKHSDMITLLATDLAASLLDADKLASFVVKQVAENRGGYKWNKLGALMKSTIERLERNEDGSLKITVPPEVEAAAEPTEPDADTTAQEAPKEAMETSTEEATPEA